MHAIPNFTHSPGQASIEEFTRGIRGIAPEFAENLLLIWRHYPVYPVPALIKDFTHGRPYNGGVAPFTLGPVPAHNLGRTSI